METTKIQYMFQEWLLFAWDFAQENSAVKKEEKCYAWN